MQMHRYLVFHKILLHISSISLTKNYTSEKYVHGPWKHVHIVYEMNPGCIKSQFYILA